MTLVACQEESPPPEPVVRSVRYAQAIAAGTSRPRTFTGTAQAASAQRLSFLVSGTVQSLPVEVGSRVRRGELLAQLDSRDYSLQQQRAEAELAQAQAQARSAVAEYERVVALYENRNASRSDLDAARASFESAEATVRSAQTGLRLAEQDVEYTTMTAPVDGVVSSVDVEVNETVSTGETIVIINMAGNPEVAVAVPSAFIRRIQAGDRVRVELDALAGFEYEATVTQVGTTTVGGGTFLVTVRLNEDTEEVRPGMAAEATFQVEGQSATGDSLRVLVPSEAVGQDQAGQFVWVLQPIDGDFATAERRVVSVGALSENGLEVLNGVEDGEYVATAGLSSLSEGQRLRLLASR